MEFFDNPEAVKSALPSTIQSIMVQYIASLQNILMLCPEVTQPITVYKVARRYPGVPSAGMKFQPAKIPQLPFNSTTLSSGMNFAPFTVTNPGTPPENMRPPQAIGQSDLERMERIRRRQRLFYFLEDNFRTGQAPHLATEEERNT